MFLTKVVKKMVNPFMKKRIFNKLLNAGKEITHAEAVSYGQNYEDVILELLMDAQVKKSGVYIDIGAHHPVRFSNTYRFYLKGWNGINVDPLPHVMEVFNEYRPDDINLNVGVAGEKGELEYYSFVEPAYNTLNSKRAAEVLEKGYTKLLKKVIVPVDTLKNILDKYLDGQGIDFLTIDVEGLELEILKSNDWDKYRPRFIVMESLVANQFSLDKIYEDSAIQFVIDKGYIAVAKVGNAVFLRCIKD